MDKQLYNKLLDSVPCKFRKEVEDEIDFNHMELEPMNKTDFIIACKWVLDGEKLRLRRVIENTSIEYIEERNKELKELEDYINKLESEEIV